MHLPKKFPLPNIFAIATRRGVKTKAVVITMALVCTLFSGFALAGQGPSQWCNDGNSSEIQLLNDPVTLNLELGPYLGNPAYLITCYSTTPAGSAAPEVTGGNIWVNHSTQNVHCFSDPAAMVKIDCAGGTNVNTQNPTSPSASADAWGQATILGTPAGAGFQTNCPYGYTAGTGGVGCGYGGPSTRPSQNCADDYGNQHAVLHDPATLDFDLGNSPTSFDIVQVCYSTTPYQSSTNQVTGGLINASVPSTYGQGTWCASDPQAMVRLDNCSTGVNLSAGDPLNATATPYAGGQATILGNPVPVQGTSAGVGLGCTSGTVAVSVSNCANGTIIGASGIGNASASGYSIAGITYPGIAISGTGCATSNQWDGSVAVSSGLNGCDSIGSIGVSGLADSGSHRIAISGTGTSYATELAAVSLLGDARPAAASPYLTVSGTGISDSRWLAISGTGNSGSWGYGAVPGAIAISGTGTASTAGSGSNPGVAISGADASGRDVAISLGQTASGTNGGQASLVNVSGGSGSISAAGMMIIDNTGLALVPPDEASVTYMPSAAAIAVKEQLLAIGAASVAYNMATGAAGGEGMSSGNSLSSDPCTTYDYCPPRSMYLNQPLSYQERWYYCGPAATRMILLQINGSAPSQNTLASELKTVHPGRNVDPKKIGTYFNNVANVLNNRQTRDTFYMRKVKDAIDYMNMLTMDVYEVNHGLANAFQTSALEYWSHRSALHQTVSYGYNHSQRTVAVADSYNYTDFGWNANNWPGQNPGGLHQNIPLGEVTAAIKGESGHIVW